MKKSTYSSPAVKKAFKILYAISVVSNGLGISDLSKKLKIGKSTVHGITAALEEMGVLVRDPFNKKYTLGYSLSRNEMKITSPPGTRLPLLTGATGRVILSQIDNEKAKEIIQKKGLTRYTSKTVIDHKQFLREIEEVKKRGYAVDNEEYITGVWAVAVPLLSTSSAPAALWVVGFTSTMDDQKVKTVIREVQETIQEIKQSLEGTLTKELFAQRKGRQRKGRS